MTFTAGQKIRATELNALYRGVIARAARTTSSTGTTTTGATTGQGVIRLSASLSAGRLYRVSSPSLGLYSSVSGDIIGFRFVYTTDGTTPTASSTSLQFAQHEVHGVDTVNITNIEALYTPSTDQTFNVLLTIWRVSGTGTIHAFGASPDWPCSILIEDLGTDPGNTGVAI